MVTAMPPHATRRVIPALLAAVALTLATIAVVGASPAQAKPKIKGIDISRFQGLIGWKRVASTRIKFAYIQASRGHRSDCLVAPESCGPDPYYERNARKARAAGLRVGAYHRAFAEGPDTQAARADARREANVFVRTVGKVKRKDLRPALDVETPFVGLSDADLRRWLRTFSRRTEKLLGVKPIIYTNQSSWLATGDTKWFARHGFPLWVANYGVPRPAMPADNWAGKGWTIWQFTSTGRVRGIDGNVDVNRLKRGFRKLLAHR
jgi:lysozyme